VSSPPEPFFHRVAGIPDVRGVVHRARDPSGDALVLTHGAGSNADSPLLVALAEAFAASGITVLRCDLPFRQARATGPPSPRRAATDRDGLRHAIAAARALVSGRVFAGGHSYGGRQATMVAAAEPALVAGLLLLAYPLHPPTRPADLRTAHFPVLRTPGLFVHGTTDPFGSIDELTTALASVPAVTRLVVVDGAGHDLGRGRRAVAGAPFADVVVSEFGRLMTRARAAAHHRAAGKSSRFPHSTHERS
jgi:predicted alpha/beta-hydrolase family hydrolase